MSSYAWLAIGGGAWSLASNWNDLTDGIDPSLTVPGASDSVAIAGPSGTAIGTITGAGQAASAAFSGNTALAGSFALAQWALGSGGTGGLLDIGAAALLQSGTGTIASGSAIVGGTGASLSVAGTLTVGAGLSGLGAASAALDATGGAVVSVQSLVLDGSSASLFVDANSVLDVGGSGQAAASGALTVESGGTLSGFGNADAYGTLVNDGTIRASGGALMIGAAGGSGTLAIAAGALLVCNGRTGPGQTVDFLGAGGTLAFSTEADAPQGMLAGFAAGDAIDVLGSPISAASWSQTSASGGVLTLFYGNQVADSLTLLGNYGGQDFLVGGDGANGSLITLAAAGSGGGTLSGGTSTPDAYAWIGTGSAAWDNRLEWQDLSSGANPAAVAPGHNDLVTIAAPATQFIVVSGPGDAASLAVSGELALAGSFAVGTLAIGSGSAPGVVDLLPGTVLTAAQGTLANGALSAVGSGTTLSVAGTWALGGGPAGVGLPATTLSALSGATIALGGLVLGGGSGNTVVTDTTGRIEIGTLGGAAAGAVTVDPGATLAGNGSVNPFGNVVDNGTIAASGGTLTLGRVGGTGALSIGAGATLSLEAQTAVPIAFAGADGTLRIAGELAAPTGTLSGFAVGDAIDVVGDPITYAQFVAGSVTGTGTLVLSYDTTIVARIPVSGSFTGNFFAVTPDGAGGTDLVLTRGGGSGGSGGQGNADLLSWTNPVSGKWSQASNWTDLTTGQPATAPPGSLNAVLITGPSNGTFQTVGGPANCASLTLIGDNVLAQGYAVGTLTVGSGSTAGVVALSGTLASQSASILDGTLALTGIGDVWTDAGTLTLGSGAAGQGTASTLVSLTRSASVQTAGLVLGGGLGDTITVDPTAVFEVGTVGGAAAGAVTIDPGILVAGNGSLNPFGSVVDNGTLTAQGGTLALGATSGAGTITIAAEATLALGGGESVGIGFAGAGATLWLGAGTPAGVIDGFAPGDQIVLAGSLLTGVSYAPGSGGIGTLTLSYGGQAVGSLLLAGNYAGDVFSLLPDGSGTAIVVNGGGGGPSGGTATPDQYVWTGAAADGLWNDAGNWQDRSAGLDPAAVAPGLNDLVTIVGPASGLLAIAGPADAASLTLVGGVALAGAYAVGALSVAGTLVLGPAGTLTAASGVLAGSVLGEGGTLSLSGTATLGPTGALDAMSGAWLEMGSLTLDGGVVATDAAGSVEIGTGGGPVAGAITVDPGAELAGNGRVGLGGRIVDDGMIAASGGTLSLGAVSGSGTLEIGVGATLALEAGAAGVVIDFAGPGTLAIAPGAMPQAAIADFTAGDAIVLPLSGITGTQYTQTAPGLGTLALLAGNQVAGTLTLLGVGSGQSFTITTGPGSTVLTTEPATNGTGGTMGQQGNYQSGPEDAGTFVASLPYYQQYWVGHVLGMGSSSGALEAYLQVSPDGVTWGAYQPFYGNVGIDAAASAYQKIVVPSGYIAMLAQGSEPLTIVDWNALPAVLVGNAGIDSIFGATGDTIVGGTGPGDLLWADGATGTIIGSANDTIITGQGNDSVQSSTGRSLIFVGSGQDSVQSNGSDTVICTSNEVSASTVTAAGSDVIWGPNLGQLTFVGGAGASTVVGGSGTTIFHGGSGSGGVFWGYRAALAEYIGGSGSATVVGGTGALDVVGGAGNITVFGGTGYADIQGAAGGSQYIVGTGPSAVDAASGNAVWLVGGANNTLVASGGNVVLSGGASYGNNEYTIGDGPCTVIGGHGSDTINTGGGPATIFGGSGSALIAFTNGVPHGADLIANFNVNLDKIGLYGYSGGAAAVLATQHVSGGNTYLTLQDGTQLTLLGVSGLNATNFVT